MKNCYVVLSVFLSLSFFGCSYTRYSYNLDSTKPTTERTKITSSTFENEEFFIEWVPTKRQVAFKLRNKTDKTIKILWNQASFIFPGEEVSGVFHQGVKYADRNKKIQPSLVPPKAELSDVVVPTRTVYYSEPTEYSSGGWEVSPFLSNEGEKQEFQVILPIKHDNNTVRYRFYFSASKVEDVEK